MRSFIEQEKRCASIFNSLGTLFHAYTPGKETALIFTREDDYIFAMNVVCQTCLKFPDLTLLAFELMSNHVHFLFCGKETDIIQWFDFFKKRLQRGLHRVLPYSFTIRTTPVNSLSYFRNCSVYINRNGYVVMPAHTPFSYPWGTGRYTFNNIPTAKTAADITVTERRVMFRGRAPEIGDDFGIISGHIMPSSYCNLALTESLFRDAHHYFSAITKNVESYAELADACGEDEYITDEEAYDLIRKNIQETYGYKSIKELSTAQKSDIARTMHFRFKSSNGQIQRILGLKPSDVEALFPLSAKRQ